MSWSVQAVGKPAAVAAKVAATLAGIKCAEPEESVKGHVAAAVAAAVGAFPAGTAVRVEAFGSQYVPDTTKPNEAVNSLSFKIEPINGFVE